MCYSKWIKVPTLIQFESIFNYLGSIFQPNFHILWIRILWSLFFAIFNQFLVSFLATCNQIWTIPILLLCPLAAISLFGNFQPIFDQFWSFFWIIFYISVGFDHIAWNSWPILDIGNQFWSKFWLFHSILPICQLIFDYDWAIFVKLFYILFASINFQRVYHQFSPIFRPFWRLNGQHLTNFVNFITSLPAFGYQSQHPPSLPPPVSLSPTTSLCIFKGKKTLYSL